LIFNNNTRIEAFFAFVIVESPLFTISIFNQNHARKSWILNTLPNGVRLARENCNKLRVKAKVTSDK